MECRSSNLCLTLTLANVRNNVNKLQRHFDQTTSAFIGFFMDSRRLDWKSITRGLISPRRLVGSCFKMASYVSIIVEICDEKMANMWRKRAKIYGLLSFVFSFSPVLVVVRVLTYIFPFVCCFTAMTTVQSHSSTFKVSACYCSLVLFLVASEKI